MRRTLLRGFLFLALLRDKEYFDVDDLVLIRENMPGMFFSAGEQPFMIGGSWFSPVLGKAQSAFRFSVFPLPFSVFFLSVLFSDLFFVFFSTLKSFAVNSFRYLSYPVKMIRSEIWAKE